MTRAIMLMGTGSDVGKSLIVAGLCRAYTRRGLSVRPFKPQNMSNNAAVTADGGEIGRAQALQARAAMVEPSVHMNPVLLKPETTTGAQVIIQGQRQASMSARGYFKNRAQFMPAILDSFQRLTAQADLSSSRVRAAPAKSTSAMATSPTWALPPPQIFRHCWLVIYIAAASSHPLPEPSIFCQEPIVTA